MEQFLQSFFSGVLPVELLDLFIPVKVSAGPYTLLLEPRQMGVMIGAWVLICSKVLIDLHSANASKNMK